METLIVQPGGTLRGTVNCPGDKSISHRAVMLGALANGTTEVTGFLEGEDTRATASAFRLMGVKIDSVAETKLQIHGVGMGGLRRPEQPLDLGNSGTSMRLLAGLLAGQRIEAGLVGDHSLMSRPMRRVVDPLRAMGASIDCAAGGTAPLHISGGQTLHGIDYNSPVASAQVKSCVLLAGISAQGRTSVREPAPSRDHTERMLTSFGYEIETADGCTTLAGGGRLRAAQVQVPADLSSAAFFIVGGLLASESGLVLPNVGINPTRTGALEILQLMGARLEIRNRRMAGAEPVADLHVVKSSLKGCTIPEALVPLAIDEFPILFVAAACADGVTTLTAAEELRHKESDRIEVMAKALRAVGIEAEAKVDGLRIVGGTPSGGTVDSAGDHRIAMAMAMLGLRTTGRLEILDSSNIRTSFPNFSGLASHAGMRMETQ